MAIYDKAVTTKAKSDFNCPINDYWQAIILDGSNVRALNDLANLYNFTDQYDKALTLFKSGLQINKYDPNLWFGIGEVYFKKGNTDFRLTILRKLSISILMTMRHYVLLGFVI